MKMAGENNHLLVLMKCSVAACQGFHFFFYSKQTDYYFYVSSCLDLELFHVNFHFPVKLHFSYKKRMIEKYCFLSCCLSVSIDIDIEIFVWFWVFFSLDRTCTQMGTENTQNENIIRRRFFITNFWILPNHPERGESLLPAFMTTVIFFFWHLLSPLQTSVSALTSAPRP